MGLAGIVPLCGGVVLAMIGWMAAHDRLPRNGWAGIRTMTTMRDDETWYAAHRAGAAWLMASGAVAVVTGLLVLAGGWVDRVAITVLLVGGLACGGCALAAGAAGQRAARRVIARRDVR